MAWVDLDQFRAYARDSTVADDALYTIALNGGHRSVGDYCKRWFDVASGTPSARSYAPASRTSQVLRIHDCVEVTSVVDDGCDLRVAADYQLEPINGIDELGIACPYDQIRRYNDYWTHDQGFARCVITADWGWAATPDSVIEATLIVAKDLLQQRNNNSGVAGFGDFGAVRVRANPMAVDLLEPLRRSESWGIS